MTDPEQSHPRKSKAILGSPNGLQGYFRFYKWGPELRGSTNGVQGSEVLQMESVESLKSSENLKQLERP